jgi:hypothetical protein
VGPFFDHGVLFLELAPNLVARRRLPAQAHGMRSGTLALIVLAVGLVTPAAAGPTRLVAGQRLPVLDAEPALDEGTFVAAAGSRLAEKYGALLLSTALDDDERRDLKANALPADSLIVVRIHRDRNGKPYLYKPCDFGYHQRTAITDTQVWMLGNESLVVPIARKTTRGKLTTIDLDTTGLPPVVASKLRLRSSSPAGHFELAVGDNSFSEVVATPAAAAKLDVVVRICKKSKVSEFDFAK